MSLMEKLEDKSTRIFIIALCFLFRENYYGTSLGVFIGVMLHIVWKVFEPVLSNTPHISYDNINLVDFIIIGIVLFNVIPYFTREKVPGRIKNTADFIDDQITKGIITEDEGKEKYSRLINKMVDDAITENMSVSEILEMLDTD